MRILLITTHYKGLGGIEQYCRALTKTLQELGHDVEVWSIFEKSREYLPEMNVRQLAPRGRWPMRIYFRMLDPYLFQLAARRSRDKDLVLVMHARALPAIYASSMVLKNCWEYYLWVYGSEVWSLMKPITTWGIIHAGKVVAVSEYTKSAIEGKMGKGMNTAVVYPPVDTRWFVPSRTKRKENDIYTLLTVGRIDDSGICYKGHDTVIKALNDIRRKLGSGIVYRIVGSGTATAHLKDLAKRHGVLESICWLGNLDREELRREYQNCDLFIMPSRMEVLPNGYVTGEGFGIVYAEAAACGKPVVGSKHGGAAEAVLDGVTGYTVDPTNVEEIADAVCAILGDPDKAREMGRAGRGFVEDNFSLDVFKAKVAELLEGM